MLKFKLSKKVRRSIAANLIKASWYGSAAFAATGVITEIVWVSVGIVVWLFTFQVIGHLVMSLEDVDGA
ncbi:MAG: hypothetical protein QM504_05440 [Pseudomonadota bacterium]